MKRSQKRYLVWTAPLAAAGLILAGCNSSNSDNATTDTPETSTSAAAEAKVDQALLDAAAADYKGYVRQNVDELQRAVKVFTDAVRAGDLQAAQNAYAPSREPWERIEPIAGLIEDIDVKVDARVDDFSGPDDPEFTGWHRLEYLLFEQNTTEGAAPFADQLDKDIAELKDQIQYLEIKPVDVSVGAAELIEEVSEGRAPRSAP